MKKDETLTISQVLLKDKKILTTRPEGMNFEEYRRLRSMQRDLFKKLK